MNGKLPLDATKDPSARGGPEQNLGRAAHLHSYQPSNTAGMWALACGRTHLGISSSTQDYEQPVGLHEASDHNLRLTLIMLRYFSAGLIVMLG